MYILINFIFPVFVKILCSFLGSFVTVFYLLIVLIKYTCLLYFASNLFMSLTKAPKKKSTYGHRN